MSDKKRWYQQSTLREALRKGAQFEGVNLNGTTLTFKRETYDVTGAHADVESAGQLNRRMTVSRLLLTGPFALALKKKKDDRELFLTVTGREFQFVVPVDPKRQLAARNFAAAINTAAGATLPTAQGVSGTDLGSQLANLAELHAQGVLSDVEFATAKAKLLG
jgi:hypothetical protein